MFICRWCKRKWMNSLATRKLGVSALQVFQWQSPATSIRRKHQLLTRSLNTVRTEIVEGHAAMGFDKPERNTGDN